MLALLSQADINAILELMSSTTASHGSRKQKVFITTVWFSMTLHAVFSPNATVKCNASKSYHFVFDSHSGKPAPVNICMTTNQWLTMVVSDYLRGTTFEH